MLKDQGIEFIGDELLGVRSSDDDDNDGNSDDDDSDDDDPYSALAGPVC